MPATVVLSDDGTLVIRGEPNYRNIGGVSKVLNLVIGRISVVDENNKTIFHTSQMFPAAKVSRVEIYGGNKNDNLSNTCELPCTMYGGDGNDLLTGGSGADCLVGGDGQDYLDGRAGNDTLVGNGDRDYLVGGPGNDSMLGGPGDDWLYGNAGDDTLIGGGGNDVISDNEGNNTKIP